MKRIVKMTLQALSAAMLTLVIVSLASSSAFAAATIVIQNGDAAGVGFNDPTAVAPVGGNPGTTLGQQRLNAFQHAANIWGATLNSTTTITVEATWEALDCTANTATLGSAGANSLRGNFSGAIFSDTWYGIALANALRGTDLTPGAAEIRARFNVDLGTPSCFENSPFYLGFDGNHGNGPDFVSVLLHELGHGLGFQTFVNIETGNQAGDPPNEFPSIYDRFLRDNTTGKLWKDMTDVERQASAIGANLAWTGANVTNYVGSLLASPRLRVNTPAAIAGNYLAGPAVFGPTLTFPGNTANLVQALDPADGVGPSNTDGCSALSNGPAISGRIALIDRGNCNFTVKVKNAQNAGAVAVVIADNVQDSPPPELGGSDPAFTFRIPAVRITFANGNTIKAQLGSGVNATLVLDRSVPAGADSSGRALLFAPNPIDEGSSVSHFDTSAFPNQLMEPRNSPDLRHFVTPRYDLTTPLFRDIGWATTNPIVQAQFFVHQHYTDFFNREPDPNGFAFWTNQITSCGNNAACIDLKRANVSAAFYVSIEFQETANVSAAFYVSIEFQETGFLVYRMYKAGYGNLPGAPVPVRFAELLPDTQVIGNGVVVGVGNWQARLESNKVTFAQDFVTRPVFVTEHPTGLSPAAFVDALFANGVVVPTAAARQQAIDEFAGAVNTVNTAARARALRLVADNVALRNLEFNKAFVLMQYFGYLRRNPNDAPDLNFNGYNFWLNKLVNEHNGNYITAEMVRAFILSDEYRHSFGP